MENVAIEEFISRTEVLKALFAPGMCYAPMQLQIIKDLPAADVAPVVHGQWYMLDDCANAGLYCSACGRRVHHEEFAYKKLKSKYCPHCGARMDRGGTAHDESERDFQTLLIRLG